MFSKLKNLAFNLATQLRKLCYRLDLNPPLFLIPSFQGGLDMPGVTPRQDLITGRGIPGGFIGQRVLPDFGVGQWSGSYPFALFDASTACTGRDGNGNMVSRNHASNLIPYNMNQAAYTLEDREDIGEAEVAHFRTMENAERIKAGTGTLAVRTSKETLIAAALLANPVDVSADPYAGVLAAVLNLQPYGTVVIAGNVQAFNVLRAQAAVKEALLRAGVPLTSVQDVRAILGTQLAAVFRAQEVIEAITVSSIWATDKVVVEVLPDPSVDPAGVPQVGRCMRYDWMMDGANVDLICNSSYNQQAKKPCLDFTAYAQPLIANQAFKVALKIA